MKPAEQEAKEIVTNVLKKMVCCIEKLPHYIENGIAKEVSLSEVDKIIAEIEEENELQYWMKVRKCIKSI
jgi:hypothetical protein